MLRKLVVAAAIVAILVVAWLGLVARNYTTVIGSYQLVTPSELVIEATGAPRGWTRVTEVVESETDVRITVQVWEWLPVSGTAIGNTVRLSVQLAQPLGNRVVRDHDGIAVRPTPECAGNSCSPPP